jgi:hypothetical protein
VVWGRTTPIAAVGGDESGGGDEGGGGAGASGAITRSFNGVRKKKPF